MTKAKTKKTGRPSGFTNKIASDICLRLMNGETLREICRDEKMPARSSVHKWLSEQKSFSDQYAQAREIQADQCFDEMFDIADDSGNDWMVRKNGGEEVEVANTEHIQRSKLRIDTRKWALARMAPKKYGDKATTQLTGPDGGPIETVDTSDRDLARKLALLLTKEAG